MAIAASGTSGGVIRSGAGHEVDVWAAPRRPRPVPAENAATEISAQALDELFGGSAGLRHLTIVGRLETAIAPRPPLAVGIFEVLTAWRAAERELGDIPADSPGWAHVYAKVAGLRAAHHRLFDEKVRSTTPVSRGWYPVTNARSR